MTSLVLPAVPGVVDEAGLRAYGHALGAALRAPVVIALRGELGAGKTTIAQAIARGAGVREDVTSPTFALVHEYAGASARVYHLDLYRIAGPHELTNLGWDEIVGGEGIVLIEWAEKAGDRLPRRRLEISLSEARGESLEAREMRVVEVVWMD